MDLVGGLEINELVVACRRVGRPAGACSGAPGNDGGGGREWELGVHHRGRHHSSAANGPLGQREFACNDMILG